MKRIFLCIMACGALGAPAVQAAEVTGASLGIDYSAFTDDSTGTVSKTALSGSLELGFDRNFGLQGDLSLGRFGLSDADTASVALHGLYHASENASLGAFFGRDEIEGKGYNFYGAEVGFEQGQFNGDAYVAAGEFSSIDGTLMGIGVGYDATEAFTLGASYDSLDVEGYDLSRAQLEAEYRIDRFALTAQLGSAEIENAGSETYFGLGAKFSFGAKRGATFDQRGVLAVWPGL